MGMLWVSEGERITRPLAKSTRRNTDHGSNTGGRTWAA